MPLKYKFKSRDEIPADVLAHYVERDGAWVLDVEGAVDRSKVDEFRANNVGLMKQLDELKARFNGIDLEETKALKGEHFDTALDRGGSKQAGAQVGGDFWDRGGREISLRHSGIAAESGTGGENGGDPARAAAVEACAHGRLQRGDRGANGEGRVVGTSIPERATKFRKGGENSIAEYPIAEGICLLVGCVACFLTPRQRSAFKHSGPRNAKPR